MIDFSNALSSTASVAVQAHWAPIADATYNLHQPTKEQFDRAKARCPVELSTLSNRTSTHETVWKTAITKGVA